jgi:cytochrome c
VIVPGNSLRARNPLVFDRGLVYGARYSTALRRLGGKWTRDRLDQFLTNPQAYVPGTKMSFAGVVKQADRRQLIEFLASGANNKPPPEDPVSE